MKIVFQKVPQWEGVQHAEEELSKRMVTACHAIGVKALATSNLIEIDTFSPDIILPLYFSIPKMFDAFTVGCMWNPSTMIRDLRNWSNIKSYDGFAVASETQKNLVKSLKFKSPSPYLLTTLFPSTNTQKFETPIHFDSAVYIGSNWSQNRHNDFFSAAQNLKVYGPRNSWQHLKSKNDAYQGEIPCDGSSALGIYHKSGIGLAFHHEKHNLEGIPSMRPFEIAASSAVMIADLNPFVQSVFGQNALYIDTSLETHHLTEQLNAHVNWIKNNKKNALEMAYACNEIFCEYYSLEILLEKLISDVKNFKNSLSLCRDKAKPRVEIIIRSDGSQKKRLFRSINSIHRQTYPNVSTNIIYRGRASQLDNLKKTISEAFPDLNINYTQVHEYTDRGFQFFSGIRNSTAEYIGFLDHDDIIFHDHVAVLREILTNNKDASLAYSGSVKVWEGGSSPDTEVVRELAYFHDSDDFDTKAYITSNSYLVRKDRIPWQILHQPIPNMDCREDRLFLKILHRNNAKFLFSEKVTCAFYWLFSKNGHSDSIENTLAEGKKTSVMAMRLSTLPWRDPSQIPKQQYFISYHAFRNLLNALKHDLHRGITLTKKFLDNV